MNQKTKKLKTENKRIQEKCFQDEAARKKYIKINQVLNNRT